VGRLKPENQQERKGFLYQSLVQERNRLETQARKSASLHVEVMDLYHEVFLEVLICQKVLNFSIALSFPHAT
jgi:DNA mismatch repair protein MutS2